MRKTMKSVMGLVLLALAATALPAQESASFKLNESTLNLGGNPNSVARPTSTSFRIGFDALGGIVGQRPLSGPSFRMDPSFAPAYRPPGEVAGLSFADADTLDWQAEPAAIGYAVYRDLLSTLDGLGYGGCLASDVAGTTLDDTDVPPSADGWFYLVTALNRLDEEGSKGPDSIGAERPNPTPCP